MSSIVTQIDNVSIKLSNLDKVLWPDDAVSKAELIQYYLSIYPYMQAHVVGRPLTLIRYPDGIHANRFYSKNAAEHTPDWVSRIGIDDISYIHIQKSADLVYIANLAALEIHAMTVVTPHIERPDTIIFDLDPSEEVDFAALKVICRQLFDLLSTLGYHPHIKTSGSKGLHLYVPILPNYSREQVFAASKALGQAFVDSYPIATLKISKEKRQGKVLIDIYRNHQGQTCIAPFSTRAKPGAPVSMPILSEHLEAISSSSAYTIVNAKEYLTANNPWKDYDALRMPIQGITGIDNEQKLATYNEKRNFAVTSEPSGQATVATSKGNRFVIQKHDASNLHYDLRLEENGVLTSWAIPKSLPSITQIKRLAIRTEDHPLKYIDFEGKIPDGEYGGGLMWIFDSGTYSMIKKSENSYKISLDGDLIKGEYSIFHTKDNQWIIERTSDPTAESKFYHNLQGPMLAEQINIVPDPKQYFFELKWDGIRATILKIGPKITILSKSGRDITEQFTEIATKLAEFDAEEAILDGELVCLDERGVPVFANIISRMHTKNRVGLENVMRSHPAVLYLFDLKYMDGRSTTNMPIEKRREWLAASTKISERIRISEAFDDGKALFDGVKALGMEGIMAKGRGSKYIENRRTNDWVKIKVRTLIDVTIIGYTKGNGDRSNLFGSLHVSRREEDKFIYMGKVGTGFDESKMIEILELLQNCAIISKPIKEAVEEEYNTTWIEGKIECEVQYASLTPNGTLREPVFFRLKEE
jgi:bifunctional non-homologous end joining protein LigD